MTATITLLNDRLINTIAAGEVVENPASVVKELTENAIDAKATVIDITIEAGGVKRITVADNGTGMNADDLALAIQRHATSKIAAIDDLAHIQTFGFRGEALASIAAVSRFSITSRLHTADHGNSIAVDGGTVRGVQSRATARGTVVDVQDLFFNTPARKKFLRSDRYERAVVADLVTALALAHPSIAFTLNDGHTPMVSFPTARDWNERARQVYGDEFAAMLTVEITKDVFTIRGFVSNATLSRANRSRQYFFVNNRVVRYPRLGYVLSEVYGSFLTHGKHPYAALNIIVDPTHVDVNVHPQKQHVKIDGESILMEAVYSHLTQMLSHEPRLSVATPRPTCEPYPSSSRTALAEPRGTYTATPRDAAFPGMTIGATPTATLSSHEQPDMFETYPFSIQKILGQIQNTYIVCETTDHMLLIDQHAAHERIMYEHILDILTARSTVAQQGMLFPLVLSLTFEEAECLRTLTPTLEALGFSVSDLGKNAFAVGAYPALFEGLQIKDIIVDVIQRTIEGSQRKTLSHTVESIAAIIACKVRSIKGGLTLQREDMIALVHELAHCRDPHHCSHGRPTMVTVTAAELEKRFERS